MNVMKMRRDAILLYGFATVKKKHAFDLLVSVQHVGAKLALATHSAADAAVKSPRARWVILVQYIAKLLPATA